MRYIFLRLIKPCSVSTNKPLPAHNSLQQNQPFSQTPKQGQFHVPKLVVPLGASSVAVVAQPSIGFLNGRFNRDGTITEDTEDCLGRITVGLTRSKSTTVLISPLDMLGLMGMAQVLAAIAYGMKGVRRGQTTWQWPTFNPDPERENQAQMARWSVNAAPDWHFPPLAIANQYKDRETGQLKRQRYRLVLFFSVLRPCGFRQVVAPCCAG